MSFSEWKKDKLIDVIDTLIDYRGKTPKKTLSGIPLITAKVVKNGFISEPNEFIAIEDYKSWITRGFPEIGDVVLTVEAPLGEVALIKDTNIALAQRIITLRGKKGILNSTYLKYFLQSDIGQNRLRERETGTTVTGIKQSELRLVEIDYPNLLIQTKIANILSSLDDKIELNRKTNQTLETLAQTLFKEMCVSKSEVLPDGWRCGKLSEVCFVQNGYAFKSKDFTDEGEIGIIKIRNISNNLVDVINTQFVSVSIIKSLDKKFKIKTGSLVIAMTGAEVGKIGITPFSEKELWLNQRVGMFVEKVKFANHFLFILLSSSEFQSILQNNSQGSAQPNISSTAIENINMTLPPIHIIEKFGEIVNPFFETILQNEKETQTLIILRDSLLPKLMKGEIAI